MLPSATFVPPEAVPGVLLRGSSVGSESRISKSKRPSGMSDVAERVKKIVVEHLNVDQEKVTDNASFIEDLGADSLDTVELDRKSTRLNSSHSQISYAVFCLKKKKQT